MEAKMHSSLAFLYYIFTISRFLVAYKSNLNPGRQKLIGSVVCREQDWNPYPYYSISDDEASFLFTKTFVIVSTTLPNFKRQNFVIKTNH